MRRWLRLFLMAAMTGLTAGLAATLMEWGLDYGSESLVGRFAVLTGSETFRFRWELLLLPAAGGLVSGLIALCFCGGATGHGTDVLTRAFHREQGRMTLKIPAIKAAACVGVISSGGSAGPEGPMAALGAAIGSTCSRVFHLSPRERRIMLIAGCAAGIGAIFRCPLGGALFAVSVLYSEPEYESEAIVPSVIASVFGYSTFVLLWGRGWGAGEHLLRDADKLVFSSPIELLPYALLGLLCGGISIFFSLSFEFVGDRVVSARRLPRWLAPVIGGLLTGGLACLTPQIISGRYEFIQSAMDGGLFPIAGPTIWWAWAGLFGSITLLKCLATSCTVGSGAAGGVLGPSLFIGGTSGAFLGAILEALFPDVFPEPLRAALIPVGMGGVLAANMRIPIAAIVIVTEMTGSYGLIVPSMLVCMTAYVIGRRWGLNHEQVPTSAESPVHAADAVVHLLESWRVADLFESNWKLVVKRSTTLTEIVEMIEPGTRPVFAVVEDRQLVGVISLPDLDRIVSDSQLARVIIAHDIMTEQVTSVYPDEDVYHALELFRQNKFYVLPVISRAVPHQWLGMLSRSSVYAALKQQIDTTRSFVLKEHRGLAEIQHEARLDDLLTAVTPGSAENLQRLMVPLTAVGHSLRDSNIEQRFHVRVIGIEQPDGLIQCPPDRSAPLSSDLRLLAIVVRDSAEEQDAVTNADPPESESASVGSIGTSRRSSTH